MKLRIFIIPTALLFSIGIITACSNTSETKSTSAVKSETTVNTKSVGSMDWSDAFESAVLYISDFENKDVENIINYKILPSNDNSVFFMRYTLTSEDSSESFRTPEDDLIITAEKEIFSKSKDGISKLKEFKNKFSIDITNVSDTELINNDECIKGGYGSDFDV